MTSYNFRRLLIHRCTLIHPGVKTGEDEYGQDIISDVTDVNIACRVDSIRERPSTSDTGTDFILTNVLFLPSEAVVSPEMRIENIFDKQGREVLIGTFIPLNINPVYDREKLHHFEVSLQRS